MRSSQEKRPTKQNRKLTPTGDPVYDLRHFSNPLEALKQCPSLFRAYRKTHNNFIALLYAIALAINENKERRSALFANKYFANRRIIRTTTSRDFFRELIKCASNANDTAEYKIASHLAKILWHLDEGKVSPTDAENVIEISGGSDKVARKGIWQPTHFHPLEYGDGRTEAGEVIDYGDEKDAKDESDAEDFSDTVYWRNTEALVRYAHHGVRKELVNIIAEFDLPRSRTPVFTVVDVLPVANPRTVKNANSQEFEGVR
jgi:hypothetical protein